MAGLLAKPRRTQATAQLRSTALSTPLYVHTSASASSSTCASCSGPGPQSEDAKRAAVGMPKGFRTMLGMVEGGMSWVLAVHARTKYPAMLSNGEYVLPAKTVQKLGGPEEIDELVRATNDGREPEGAERDEGRHTLRKLGWRRFQGPLWRGSHIAAPNRSTNPALVSVVRQMARLQGPTRPIGTAATHR